MQAARITRTFFLLFALASGRVDPGLADSLRYRAVALTGPGSVTRLRVELGPDRFLDVLKLNRIDLQHALLADTLVLPTTEVAPLEMSPWPLEVPEADLIRKLLLVSLRVQAFGAYERGALKHWGPISSGRPRTQNMPGLYFVNWKARTHVSSSDSTWIMPWCVNIDVSLGTAIHQYALPGWPASHCCIRLLEEDAHWAYDWVESWALSPDGRSVLAHGTPVIVIGQYDFDMPPPWRRLPSDPEATLLRDEEMESVLGRLPRL